MRAIEHRRHGRRDPGGLHLNSTGRSQAQCLGAALPRFDRVVTSPRPRAVETAEAMGRTVDASIPALAEMPDEVGGSVDELHLRSFADYVTLVERNERMAAYAAEQADRWRVELEHVADGGTLLMISHGGIIEFGTASAVPHVARTWGRTLGYLEGVRLTWDGRRWSSGTILRVPP